MSDSEETKPGASSALLNIASAYSDSDSSQENSEESTPQKSLGSLVENLRAEAKRFDGDVTKACEEQNINSPTATNLPLDPEKAQSVTKIVRLDSGKVVKIRTSPGSKAPEIRHEETHSKSGYVTDFDVDSNAYQAIKIQNTPSENFNVTVEEAKIEDTVKREVNTDLNIPGTNDLDTRIESVSNETNSFVLKGDVNIATNTVEHPRVFNTDSVNAGNSTAMGIRNTKEEVKPDDDVIIESSPDTKVVQESFVKIPDTENPEVERLLNQTEHSEPWVSGSSSVITSECDDDIQDVTPINIDQGTNSVRGVNITQKEQKTESNILNAYLKSKQGLKTKESPHKIGGMGMNMYEMNRNPEIMYLGHNFERGNFEKPTEPAVSGSNINAGGEPTETIKTDESLRSLSAEEGLVSKLDIYEVKPRPELKPLPRLERIKAKTGTESLLKKTDQELQSSSPALYKMLESCESAPVPEVRKGTSPAPIKLKRNFSCISSAGNAHPEKKFIPEPSEATRITSTDEASFDVPATPVIPDITVLPVESRPQQEPMKSPPLIKIPSPSRSPLSPTFQQVSPHSYQPSFTNMINTSPNQVPTFQPLKKSPQPVSPQPLQRTPRREEPKRTLPLILRKADLSGSKVREPHRIDETGTKAPFRKEEVNASSKMMNEGEISIETISLESQEQSASVPFSNSSSNQENSNFATSVNFENVIGSSTVSKEPETPLSEDGGSDNARPPPTPTKEDHDEKQPISFLSQSVEPMEMPTIIIPKKRGRPRKFPLPESSTLVGTWPTADKNGKSTPKSGKRKKTTKKYRAETDVTDDDDSSKKRYIPRYKKKTKPTGEEAEVTRSFNKKGRMEVVTEGCKPVTVNQITEYFWPPLSSLPPGEKPEGLMIQEQISEYLGVKSFKRKYPQIKRRTVDMEERNYLQENGYVSENMCDMGLTAVYSADIMEIMYNDFPHKFEEYRRYTREKKMREQKALREKQAAENMDPRKEALESIVSWNTEFNSSRKMDKPKRSYNYQVLLGEWYERKVDEEFKVAMYLKKKERGHLLLSKVRKLFSNLLKDVQLSLPTRGLAYGGLIQLVAPDVPGYAPNDIHGSNKGLVLAVTLEADDVDYKQDFDDNMLIVGSPVLGPCARNSFYIDPEDKRKKGQPLCFGDVFSLRCGADTQVPFHVSVPVLSPFGIVGKSGYPVPRLSMHRSFDSRFRVFHIVEHMRKETLGLPVSPFEKVLVVHAPVNVPLCVESWFWENSLFSAECEISIRSTQNLQKEYEEANKWIFIVGTVK